MPQQSKHRHHILPKLYLRGFAEGEASPFVWIYTRGQPFKPGRVRARNNPHRSSIKAAAVEVDGYAFERRDGTVDSDTFENILERIEKPSDRILRKLRRFESLTLDDKVMFTHYVLLMYKRTYRRQEVFERQWNNLVGSSPTLRRLRAGKMDLQQNRVEEILREYSMPRKDIRLRTMVMFPERVVLIMCQMTWRFLIASSGTHFVAGDNPVYIDESIGIGNEHSELLFPISSDVALFASWRPGRDRSFTRARPSAVKQVNRRVASLSRQLFYCQITQSVCEMLNREAHQISPLGLR